MCGSYVGLGLQIAATAAQAYQSYSANKTAQSQYADEAKQEKAANIVAANDRARRAQAVLDEKRAAYASRGIDFTVGGAATDIADTASEFGREQFQANYDTDQTVKGYKNYASSAGKSATNNAISGGLDIGAKVSNYYYPQT